VTKEAALEAYFAEAASWDADRAAQAKRRERWLVLIAVGGWVCAIAASLAIMALTPLKHVEPFVVRVDNATGVVDVVPVFAGEATMPEAVTRYFLNHYVSVCERFTLATAESDYEECGSFHTAARNQVWSMAWSPSNSLSPLNTYKDGTTIRAQVSAVSFFERASGVADLAQVRYVKARRPGGGGEEQLTHWIATIQYAFAEPAKDPRTRRWNPLGFKILEFKAEPEVLTEPAERVAGARGHP
jgi:type IV secretion system protein VirB8